MADPASPPRLVRFGVFELDLESSELRKSGLKIRLQEQPFQILAMLLERPGRVVTREELCKKLWPGDTFVDFDNSLTTGINKIREVLGDSADNPRFVETLPRRGYRFIAPVDVGAGLKPAHGQVRDLPLQPLRRFALAALAVVATLAVLVGFNIAGLRDRLLRRRRPAAVQRPLTQLTFEPGLNAEPTWSPDGRFIAYSSDRSGNFDIWVRQVSGGNPEQVTTDPAQDRQPDGPPTDGRSTTCHFTEASSMSGGGSSIPSRVSRLANGSASQNLTARRECSTSRMLAQSK